MSFIIDCVLQKQALHSMVLTQEKGTATGCGLQTCLLHQNLKIKARLHLASACLWCFSVLPWGWWRWLKAIEEAHGGGIHENLSELTKAY